MQHNLFSSLPKRPQKHNSVPKQRPNHHSNKKTPQEDPPLELHLSTLSRAQTQLEQEIQSINITLQKMNRKIGPSSGLLFQLGVDYHLATALQQLVSTHPKIIRWTFAFHKLPHSHPAPSQPNAERLPPISVSNSGILIPTVGRGDPVERKFVFARYQKPSRHFLDKWQYFSKGASPQFYQQRRRFKTEQKNHQLHQPRPSSLLGEYLLPKGGLEVNQGLSSRQQISRSAINAQHSSDIRASFKPQREEGAVSHREVFAIPDIHQMLQKQYKLLSIWAPPPKEPELLGVASIMVQQKQDGSYICLIKKYWWVQKAINQRFFNCIIEWLSSQQAHTTELSLLTSKTNYDSFFAPLGWQLTNWIRQDKLRITYKRLL